MTKEKSVDESWKDSTEKDKDRLANIQGEAKSEKEGVITGVSDFDTSDEEEKVSEATETEQHDDNCGCGHDHGESSSEGSEGVDEMEINFVNYVSGLGFQAMIFMGEIPNPVTNEMDKNLQQSKFLIDTLVMMKEKTAGNLSDQEDGLLGATLYELQLKYVEAVKKDKEAPSDG